MADDDFIEFPKIARLSREIIITEKIDGTNGVVFVKDDGSVIAGSRSQWLIGSDNFGFAKWVHDHTDELRRLGVGRHYGEWWGSGIQRGYGLPQGEKRFSLFNIKQDPIPACCHIVPLLYTGIFDTSAVEVCIDKLRTQGSVASPGFMRPEGIVLYHRQGNVGFKKTIEKDDEWKGKSKPK